MISALGKKLKEIIDMDVTIVKHPGSDLIEIWINNVFICQGQNVYINHHIENQAAVEVYYPEDYVGLSTDLNKNTETKDPFFTEAEELPFN